MAPIAATLVTLCLAACQLRVDLDLTATPNGRIDVTVAVVADDDVRSSLERAGLADRLDPDVVAADLPAWVATISSNAEFLVARGLAPDEVEGAVADLVEAVGLGPSLLDLEVMAPSDDAGGLDVTATVGLADLEALAVGDLRLDPQRWADLTADADDVVEATLRVALPDGVDAGATIVTPAAAGVLDGAGMVWPVAVGHTLKVRARARPLATSVPAAPLVVTAFAVGVLGGAVSRRRSQHRAAQ